MEYKGEFIVPAQCEKVWSILMDAEMLAKCVPGAEQIKMVSPDQYEAEMTVKVPFMTLRFQATGKLQEAQEGEFIKVEMTGKPMALAGMFRNRLKLELNDWEDGATKVRYTMNLQMTGRLATLGEILVKNTIEKTTQDFAENVKHQFDPSCG